MQGSLVPSTRQPIDGVMYHSGHAPVVGRQNQHAMASAALSAATSASSRFTEPAGSPTIINTLMSVMAEIVFVFGF